MIGVFLLVLAPGLGLEIRGLGLGLDTCCLGLALVLGDILLITSLVSICPSHRCALYYEYKSLQKLLNSIYSPNVGRSILDVH